MTNLFTLGEQLAPETREGIVAMTKQMSVKAYGNKAYTKEEDETIITLHGRGFLPEAIAASLHERSAAGVASRIHKLRKAGRITGYRRQPGGKANARLKAGYEVWTPAKPLVPGDYYGCNESELRPTFAAHVAKRRAEAETRKPGLLTRLWQWLV